MDDVLGALARGEAALRLRLGQVLEVVGRSAVFALGFSSVGAYAVERCERSGRWAEVARCMARRLEALPQLRQAVATGNVSWSMAELVARVAQPVDDAAWVELAAGLTVRQMRVRVAEALGRLRAGSDRSWAGSALTGEAGEVGEGASKAPEVETVALEEEVAPGVESSCVSEEACSLTCTIDQEEAWLFEATRSLLEQLGVLGVGEQCEALLAEAQGTLLALWPEGMLALDRTGLDEAQQRWLAELARWRAEAEIVCENNAIRPRQDRENRRELDGSLGAVVVAASRGMASLALLDGEQLDAIVRALGGALARHELDLSRLILSFHRADGWRRLGYATETQYARERLGASRSSMQARRSLALRLEKLPAVATALGAGQIGVEAAIQIVRVATEATVAAWVDRARKRTIKHLREEVAAALTAVRWSGEADCLPPADADMGAFQALEQAVVSGRCQVQPARTDRSGSAAARCMASTARLVEPVSEQRRAWLVMLGSLATWLDGALSNGFQMSAGATAARAPVRRSAGRVTLRLRMSRSTFTWWRALEAQARAWLPRGMSWLRFLCLSLWGSWQHLLGTTVAYGHIYIRDRYRCMSPVCNRRDVTPHHLQFRSAGGSDEPFNVGSFCTWCHLCGVHGGRIRARGTAELIHWEFGAPNSPCLVVHGRERVAS